MTKGISTLELAAETVAVHAAVRVLIADRWRSKPDELKTVHEASLEAARLAIKKWDLGENGDKFIGLLEAEFDKLFGPIPSDN